MVGHNLLCHGEQLLLKPVLPLFLENAGLLQDLLLLLGFEHNLLLLRLPEELLLFLEQSYLLLAQRLLLVLQKLLIGIFNRCILLRRKGSLSVLRVFFGVHAFFLFWSHRIFHLYCGLKPFHEVGL